MEAILSQLLEPDNEIIKAATAQLRTAFKQPGVIPELCTVLRQDNGREMKMPPRFLKINLLFILAEVKRFKFVSMPQSYCGRSFPSRALGSSSP